MADHPLYSAIRSVATLLCGLAACVSPALAQTTQTSTGQLDDVKFECVRYPGDDDLPLLTTINNHLAIQAQIFPYRGDALRMKPDCQVDVLEKMVSWDEPRTVWDLRRSAEDRYVYQQGVGRFGYWNGSLWFRNGRGDLLPPFFPVPPGPLDPHVSVTHAGETNFFLFYVTRKIGFDRYAIDTEVAGFLPSGQEVWRWASRGQVPAEWSKGLVDKSKFEDRLHTNSIQVLRDALVIGVRDLDAVLLVPFESARLVDAVKAPEWTFVDDPAGGFSKAHTPQITERGTLLMFDNGWMRARPYPSRAVEYKLDFKAKTATMIWERKAAADYPNRNTMGSVVELADGRRIIGWGAIDQQRACGTRQMVQMHTILRGDSVLREVRMPCGWSSYAARPDQDEAPSGVSLNELMKR